MGSQFKMNPNFHRELSRQLQEKFDEIHRRYAGQSVDTVKAALKREGLSGEDELDMLATAISSGQRVDVRK